jgi:Icc-related predicted phosphoesterase
MKLQVFSDLHVDVATVKTITIADDVDVVVVAGDTCERVLRALKLPRPSSTLPIETSMRCISATARGNRGIGHRIPTFALPDSGGIVH